MSIKEIKCPKCGAPVSPEKEICPYCGTYYVIENEVVYTLDSRLATDENMEKYIKRTTLQIKHHLESTGLGKYIKSEEEIRQKVYMVREHLKEERGTLPTIKEVDRRSAEYTLGKMQTEMVNVYLWYEIAGLVMIIFFAIIFFWIISSMR
jgi:uncharacterized Zn finger protein (UPF0148 family)